jgi:hypothetical protein
VAFNDLLTAAGIRPADVCIIRHHTPARGMSHATLCDLWRDDPTGFTRYQATQERGRPLFRKRKIWAAFVCPAANETMFIGLFDASLTATRKADWLCDYRGNAPGGGEPIDIFATRPRVELAEYAGVLRVDWPSENRRSWARKAEKLDLPLSAKQPEVSTADLAGDALVGALVARGFAVAHETKKLIQLRRGSLVVYVKRDTATRPLVVDPHFVDLADALRALDGIDIHDPPRSYINSNLRAFPAYIADHRSSEGRHGFAIGVRANRLGALLDLLERGAVVSTSEGDVRVVAPEDDPLTERERLQSARVGQGPFRDALLIHWDGRCPVAGVDHAALLRASHIKPWSVSSDHERLDPFNGILLCVHIDALFDRHLITFEDCGIMRIAAAVSMDNRKRLGIFDGMRIKCFDARHAPYLAHHRSLFRP